MIYGMVTNMKMVTNSEPTGSTKNFLPQNTTCVYVCPDINVEYSVNGDVELCYLPLKLAGITKYRLRSKNVHLVKQTIESEIHFLIEWPLYDNLRYDVFHHKNLQFADKFMLILKILLDYVNMLV